MAWAAMVDITEVLAAEVWRAMDGAMADIPAGSVAWDGMVEHQAPTPAGPAEVITEVDALCGVAKVLARFLTTRIDEAGKDNHMVLQIDSCFLWSNVSRSLPSSVQECGNEMSFASIGLGIVTQEVN